MLRAYAGHYSGHRPHQCRHQRPPNRDESVVVLLGVLVRRKVPGDVINNYHRVA